MAYNGYPYGYPTITPLAYDRSWETHVYYGNNGNSVNPDPVKDQMPKTANDELLLTLREIDPKNHYYVFLRCREYNIRNHQLRYLSERHIRQILPTSEVGIWAEFSFLHAEWKKKNFGSSDAATQTCEYNWLIPK